MMDVFNEHMVKKRITGGEFALMALISVGAVVLSAAAFLFVPMVGSFAVLGIGYLAFRLINGFFIEYEYIVTNGIMDVDRIVSRRRRKRLITCDCRECEIIAPVPIAENDPHRREFDTPSAVYKVDYSAGYKESSYFMLFTHKKHGKTRIIFEPNEKMLKAFKVYVSRKLFVRGD